MCKPIKNDYSIDEAVRVLSAYGLEEVQEVLRLSDDDITDILLNEIPPKWEQKIMEWFNNYLINQAIDAQSNN
jgi:hypothetical protein